MLGNLALALGFSAGLHAALITSLEGPAVRPASAPPQLRLNLRVVEPLAAAGASTLSEQPAVPAPHSRPTPTVSERYFTAREVDTPARPRITPALVYPEDALIWKLRGVVRLRVFISELGTVDSVKVVRAEPPGEFEEAAIDAARRLVYEPAIRSGRAVKSQKLIEVTFDPDETPPQGAR